MNYVNYVGTVITKQEILSIVASLLNVPISVVINKNNKDVFVDARLITVNEIRKRSNYSVEEILSDLNFKVKRPSITIGLGKFQDRYKFNKEFKDKVDAVKNYLESINVNERTKVI